MSESYPLIADTAIDDSTQDRLDRVPFAKSLAGSILSLEGDDSFVIGLCGPWGSGKTSVLNLLLNELESTKESVRPIVVRFNPWWYSGHNQLLEAFLTQFAAALDLPDTGEGAKKLSKLFQRLSIGLRPLSFLPVIGEAVKAGSDLSKSVGDAAGVYADALRTDVHAARKEIDKGLEELDRRIVIVMDDIDRLSADEIAELFLILKAVADFPKTVYLLAFDHRVVRRAIRQKLGVNGKVYLEKIVQLQIELPSVGNSAIQQIFLEQVGELLDEGDFTDDIKQDFGNIFHDGVKQLLKTPRASKKLLNTLRFTFPSLKGEVYFPDLVGIATLFTFAPSVVQVIASNAERFTGTERFGQDRGELGEFHKAWLDKVEPGVRQWVEEIVTRLFPKFAWAMDGPGYSSDFDTIWRRNLRVCSSAHFDKYFLLALPSGTISEKEWSEVVECLPDCDQFERLLMEMTGQRGRHGLVSRGKEFLDRLEDFASTSEDKDKLEAVFRSVLKLGDKLIAVKDEEVIGGLLPWDNEQRVMRILGRSLDSIGDEGDRLRVLTEAIESECGLLTVTEFAHFLGREHGMFGAESREDKQQTPLLPEENVKKVLNKVNRTIIAASEEDGESELAKNPFSLLIVRNWSEIGSETTAGRWVRRQAKRDEFLLGLLDQASSKIRSHGMSDRVVRETLTVDTRFLDRFVNLKQLKRRCGDLLEDCPDWLTDEQIILLRLTQSQISDDGEPLDARGAPRERAAAGEPDDDTQ